MEQKLDIIKCYKEAWQSFRVHWKLAIGGMLIYFLITYSGSIAQYSNAPFELQYIYWLMYLFVFPPLMLGVTVLSLNLAGVSVPELKDLLSGFRTYWKSIGLYLLYMLIISVISLPFVAIFGFLIIGAMFVGAESYVTVLIILGIIIMGIVLSLTVRWFLVFFVLADEQEIGIIACFKRSSQITKGNRLRLIGSLLMIIPVMLIGMLAFGIGILVAAPICMIALARAYLWLKSFHPPLDATSTEQIVS